MIGLISSSCLIFLGVMTKYSTNNDGWSPTKKYANYFIIGGIISLVIHLFRMF